MTCPELNPPSRMSVRDVVPPGTVKWSYSLFLFEALAGLAPQPPGNEVYEVVPDQVRLAVVQIVNVLWDLDDFNAGLSRLWAIVHVSQCVLLAPVGLELTSTIFHHHRYTPDATSCSGLPPYVTPCTSEHQQCTSGCARKIFACSTPKHTSRSLSMCSVSTV